MEHVASSTDVTVSYETYGSGPPLVLVHGGFSDHQTNWQEVKDVLSEHFTVYAVARRGRGETTPTQGHAVRDEAADVAAVLRAIHAPVYVLGHSYGAVCALSATALTPSAVSKLILYEPPFPQAVASEQIAVLESLAERQDWDGLVQTFMLDVLHVPRHEVEHLRATPTWGHWTADARASVNDLRALVRHQFDPAAYGSLSMPVLLLVGTESPRDLYITDALAAVLPNVRIQALDGQAHEGMTTAPNQFVDAVVSFLLE